MLASEITAAYYDFIDNFADGEKTNEAQEYYAKLAKAREKFLLENPIQDEL